MNNFASITNHTQKIVLLLKSCAIFVLIFKKSSSLKANKLHGANEVLKLFKITLYLQLLSFLLYHLICSNIIKSNLVRPGNVHENPGPNDCNLRFFHWNLDSLTARNNTKISLIEAYNSVFNYDLIAVSDTRLNQSIDNEDIQIEGFNSDIFRSDHPSNSRVPGGVCIYYKENIPIKRRKDLEILQEFVVTEITFGRKKLYFIVLYRHPHQTSDEFDLSHLIDEPTNIRTTGMSCIDLIITDQPNLFVDFGVHSSFDDHCQHQIIHGKLNISVPIPPTHKRKVWYYAKAQKDKIKSAIANIRVAYHVFWVRCRQKTHLFTSNCASIFSEFIANKVITCDNRDPPWMTPSLKSAIKCKHRVYNKYVKRGRKPDDWEYVRAIRNQTSSKITKVKDEYFSSLGKKLSDPTHGIKSYWSTLNKIINKKKFSNIPPLLENGVFVTNFQTKANILNNYFVEQCSLIVSYQTLAPDVILHYLVSKLLEKKC